MKLTANFSLEEFACKDGTPVPEKYIPNTQLLADNLQAFRDYINKDRTPEKEYKIKVNSGYRTESYNKKIGGKPKSKHLVALAADFKVPGMTNKKVYDTIEFLILEGIMKEGGLELYPTFVHYDSRGVKARW
jgi:uncharacterized protein YcbK (DUF882 family)